MKILLVGHSIIDHFEKQGSHSVTPGGIYYSVLGMLSCVTLKDEVFLISGINTQSSGLFEKLYTRINLEYSNNISALPEVLLKIYDDKEREEVYSNLSTQLLIDKVKNWNQFDGILINMITGFDISVEQFNTIRLSYNGLIYFDIHTLLRGVDKNMSRIFRQIPEAGEWLSCIDILQCNEFEIKTVFGLDDEHETVLQIFQFRPKAIIVTKGEKGATLYYKVENEILDFHLPAEKINVINKVGCGDIFGAVFFYSYLSKRNLIESLRFANLTAAIAVSKDILNNIDVLKNND